MKGSVTWIFAALLLGWWGCESPEPESTLPGNEKLIDIFVDLHLSEMPLTRAPHAVKDSIGEILREKVARQHS